MGVSAYRRIGVPAYRRIGVSAYFLPGSAYRHIGVFASWMGASENQGSAYRRIGVFASWIGDRRIGVFAPGSAYRRIFRAYRRIGVVFPRPPTVVSAYVPPPGHAPAFRRGIKELFELPDVAPLVSESRGASEAAKVWQATQRQAMRIKPRPAWQPRDEVPLTRRRQQEKEWKRLLSRKPRDSHVSASACSAATRSSQATAETAVSSLPAGMPSHAYDKHVERDGCFLWRSQVVAAFNEPQANGHQVPVAFNTPDDVADCPFAYKAKTAYAALKSGWTCGMKTDMCEATTTATFTAVAAQRTMEVTGLSAPEPKGHMGRFKGRCYLCGEKGHSKSHCKLHGDLPKGPPEVVAGC
ncbi:hypothetical protein AK812_SmicGene36108 [Symbiodinium microadriaticum]|uniref:CCHC-type domain-containing protein n=1 Tax=Symbiodinium microadriaticum TaxID=2951 RepID=A0A1Q9CJR7_SYMMI|nr:hypothetical protein AK812_SmicGene36108 [Symbiodinium microadriaticum]